MPNWEGSDRRQRLPADWSQRRQRVLRRDGHRCTHRDRDGFRCTERATEVDHVRRGDDHAEHNLTSLCTGHHATKSGAEGAAAMHARRRQIHKKFRRVEQHPGSLTPRRQ